MNGFSVPPGTSSSSSRRRFLTRAVAVGIIPLATGLFIYRSHTTAPSTGPAALPGLADFLPALDSSFVTTAKDASPGLSLLLAKAEPGKQHQPGGAEQFSLRFTAPDGHPFESRTYLLQHATLGSLELFITPVGASIMEGHQQKGEAVICLAPRKA